jgi:protein TonB
MPAHADILDRPEPLTAPFWVSLTLHVTVVVSLAAGAFLQERNHLSMGSVTGGGLGGVLVKPVASIPLPDRGGPENPVANDTKSQVPTPPIPKEKPKPKPAPKPKPLSPDEILLQEMEKAPARRKVEPAPQNKFREQQKYSDSQLYSDAGQRMNSSQFAVQGGGGVRIGDSSPFGEQFGAYANIVRDNIARNWRPANLGRTPVAPSVTVTFTIHRDGSVGNVKIARSSGIQTLDLSAQRAVLDAQLPPLPPNFPRPQADVDLKFELGN